SKTAAPIWQIEAMFGLAVSTSIDVNRISTLQVLLSWSNKAVSFDPEAARHCTPKPFVRSAALSAKAERQRATSDRPKTL
ncbi:MAG: hypothetical protein RLN85_10630, partial [Pseudomonadales bacterium]